MAGDDGDAPYSVFNIFVSVKKIIFHFPQLEIGQY